MADNVELDAMTGGSNVATDERTINALTVHVQRMADIGATAIAPARVEVSSTEVALAAARDTRRRLVIVNYQPVRIYIGATGLTAADGLPVPANSSIELLTTAAVYALTSAAYTAGTDDDKVAVLEEYDS